MKAPHLCLPKLLAFSVAVRVMGEGLVVNASDLAPELFAPGVISTDLNETSGSFSPDGKAFYFARWAPYTTAPTVSVICVSYLRNDQWTPAQVVSFSGTYLDGSPFIAPDGKRLYFASTRPTHSQPDTTDWNIWFVERQGNNWSEPQEIGAPVNTPQRETNPTVARDGTLYFASDRDSQPGYTHIYRAHLTKGHYDHPEKLGPEVNGGEADTNPFISPDGRILIFASYSRKDTLRDGGNLYPHADLYLSVNRDGQWTAARHLEHGINSPASDGNPIISPDGKWFYFTSERSPFQVPVQPSLATTSWRDRRTIENGVGNIYRISIKALELEKSGNEKSTDREDDAAAVHREYVSWLHSYEEQDLAGTMEIFAPDVIFTFAGSADNNFSAVLQSYERSFASKNTTRRWTPINSELKVSGDLAYMLADWQLSDDPQHAVVRLTNRSIDVLKRTHDGWKIIRSFTVPRDTRPVETTCDVPLPAISPESLSGAGREVWQTLMRWMEAYNAHDLEGTLAPFDPMITGFYAGSAGMDTLASLRQSYARSFAAHDHQRSIEFEPTEEVLTSGDFAFVRDHWTSLDRTAEGETRRVSRGIEVWRKDERGDWKLLHYLSYRVCQ